MRYTYAVHALVGWSWWIAHHWLLALQTCGGRSEGACFCTGIQVCSCVKDSSVVGLPLQMLKTTEIHMFPWISVYIKALCHWLNSYVFVLDSQAHGCGAARERTTHPDNWPRPLSLSSRQFGCPTAWFWRSQPCKVKHVWLRGFLSAAARHDPPGWPGGDLQVWYLYMFWTPMTVCLGGRGGRADLEISKKIL